MTQSTTNLLKKRQPKEKDLLKEIQQTKKKRSNRSE